MPATNSEWSFGGFCEDPLRVADQIFENCYSQNPDNWHSRVKSTLSSLLSGGSWQKVTIYIPTPRLILIPHIQY